LYYSFQDLSTTYDNGSGIVRETMIFPSQKGAVPDFPKKKNTADLTY